MAGTPDNANGTAAADEGTPDGHGTSDGDGGDIVFAPAHLLAGRLLDGTLSAVDLLEAQLAQVDRFNPALNAVIWQDRENARRRAEEADAALKRGEHLGPLHGLSMTVKEAFDVAGAPTTWGEPALAGREIRQTAVAVERLEAAGAIVYGKTNVPLHLTDVQSFNDVYGTTGNPWDPTRTCGGSSGGAAVALATGMSALELGSDIGGSLRVPPHFCGVCGHRPTYGTVPLRGHDPMSSLMTYDLGTGGPMGRTAEDLALGLSILAGFDDYWGPGWSLDLGHPNFQGAKDLRVAVMVEDPLVPIDEAYAARLEEIGKALSEAGARVSFEARPQVDLLRGFMLYSRLLFAALGHTFPEKVRKRMAEEAAAAGEDDASFEVERARGVTMSHADWLDAQEERLKIRQAWRAFFEEWDVMLTPVTPGPAFPHMHGKWDDRRLEINGAERAYTDLFYYPNHATLADLPATVVPGGLSPGGLPLGVQLIAGQMKDYWALAAARIVGDVCGGFRAPPLCRPG